MARPFRIMAGPNGSIQGPGEAKWGYTTFSVADWDGDGLPDIVLNSIWGRVEWLRNVGTRTQPRLSGPRRDRSRMARQAAQARVDLVDAPWQGAGHAVAHHAGGLRLQPATACPIWRCSTPKAIWRSSSVRERDGALVLLPPRRVFVDEGGRPLRLNDSAPAAAAAASCASTDWDGDGKFDFLVNSANADLLEQVDARDGKWFFRNAGPIARQNIEGHDVSPTVVDFDGDGVPDFLGGAEDGHFYFLANPGGAIH